ncbi:MAG: hypothetical protein A2V93_09840 [Ignavibacteria bacterium RBG_16_34_14]|nr:MAG: hypothetical protein A2V93_09840 [Ignavibacteria bacterium RBG_16_34_14]
MKKLLNKFILLHLLCFVFQSCNDSSIEPEEQFVQIYFKYDFRNELNTFDNTYQKDLILDGVIIVPFWLTAEEQNKIIKKANDVNFFSMPDTFNYSSDDSIAIVIDPNPGEQVLRIKFNGKDKTTIWIFYISQNDPQLNALIELRKNIISITESKPEYKRLPPANGGNL